MFILKFTPKDHIISILNAQHHNFFDYSSESETQWTEEQGVFKYLYRKTKHKPNVFSVLNEEKDIATVKVKL